MNSLNLIVFGITSNLAQIKLIPAFYDLEEQNLLPKDLKVIGVARSPKTEIQLQEYFTKVLHLENRHHQHEIRPEVLRKLLAKVDYIDGDVEDADFYSKLKGYLTNHPSLNTIYYLATYPNLYARIFDNLQRVGLNKEEHGFIRLMIEKPIGNDYQSAKDLNQLLLKYFAEEQIYRLDHYLGKETLQNILTFRFANSIFEQFITKEYIDHIQVTLLEDFGIGTRGGYFDVIGSLKDVGQNHMLQMIAFAMMEKPAKITNEDVTKERTKVLENLVPEPDKIVYGQYTGYRQEENVKSDSKTDTYFAFRTQLKTARFAGVPIYVRSGKKLKQTVAEISIVFKTPIETPFASKEIQPNVLIYRIQPNEGIVLKMMTKKAGLGQDLEPTYMQFCYKDYSPYLADPYERLFADAIKGDQTFFNDAKEVEESWKFIDPLVQTRGKPHLYKVGTYGPKEADELIEADGRSWLEPSNLFCKI